MSEARRRPLRRLVLAGAAVALAGALALALFALPRWTSSPVGVTRGAELYQENCFSCHGGAQGGRMMDWPPRHNANGHTWHHPDCQLKEVIRDGSGEMGEAMRRMMNVPPDAQRMPSFRDKLSDAEIEMVLAYIKTWWTEEQRRFQAEVTREVC